eukprot:TRINITY_DN58106_c0_g1_i1.p1 TRINITY_DN58106_c0_g1~~TRINITY_DN58106_c0_g1_i1.p1  ORF type:complete len:144 (-),score=13.03 TRINITY_DN58106_c0_g1_i1:275-706(-)
MSDHAQQDARGDILQCRRQSAPTYYSDFFVPATAPPRHTHDSKAADVVVAAADHVAHGYEWNPKAKAAAAHKGQSSLSVICDHVRCADVDTCVISRWWQCSHYPVQLPIAFIKIRSRRSRAWVDARGSSPLRAKIRSLRQATP